jgi:hypothetical protein
MRILLSLPLLAVSSTLYKYIKRWRPPTFQLTFELHFSIKRLTVRCVESFMFPSAEPSAELTTGANL